MRTRCASLLCLAHSWERALICVCQARPTRRLRILRLRSTQAALLALIRFASSDPSEAAEYTEMLDERFCTYQFWRPLPKAMRKANFPKCGRCCAALHLDNGCADAFCSDVQLEPPHKQLETTPPALITELESLAQLRERGLLSEGEFSQAKARLLACSK